MADADTRPEEVDKPTEPESEIEDTQYDQVNQEEENIKEEQLEQEPQEPQEPQEEEPEPAAPGESSAEQSQEPPSSPQPEQSTETPETLQEASEETPSTPPVPQVQTPQETPKEASAEEPAASPGRPRTDSQSTAATVSTQRPSRSSLVFVVTALETIANSKDARKNKKLGDATQQALSAIKDNDPSRMSPEVLFEPLRLASEAYTVQVVIAALDCIGKLISYSYFSTPSEAHAVNPEEPPLIERAIDTICDCFQGEATHVDVQLQIVKSLLAAILNDKIVVHGAGLLKAVRLTYNIFLLSKSSANQQVAQGALTQMVGTVFERVKARLALKESRLNPSQVSLGQGNSEDGSNESEENGAGINGPDVNGEAPAEGDDDSNESTSNVPSDKPVEKHTGPKITLQSFENNMSFNDDRIHDNAPTLVTRLKTRKQPHRTESGHLGAAPEGSEGDEDEEDEIFVKDAYLVFRAMCRLSTKSLPVDQALDVRSQGMRSKLLSLHIIQTIIHNNVAVFISPHATIRSSSSDEPTSFIQAIKQYLCLSLSRNGASSVKNVFEVSCDIFWLMLRYLRVMLKKEIEVFLKEIYFAILEKRTAPTFQKEITLRILMRLAADPRALVEMYLNYDCDRTALDNMYQRLVEHLSRISSTPVAITPMQQQVFQEQHAKQPASSDWQSKGTLPPSLSTAAMHAPTDTDPGYPPEYALKQESLEALVEILRSLVNWAQQGFTDAAATMQNSGLRVSEDTRMSLDTRDGAPSPHLGGTDSPSGTPMAEDDPNELEYAKRRKTALVNAIRQFNYKSKRGLKILLDEGFITENSPQAIARFFLANNDQIDKKTLGEFLGEGEPENIAIMHAFVDNMDFTRIRFVDALRRFLQSFRLPGEAQKIDRFMLKFAERYISGNPNAFANADTAYVLAYSVIMLNTDQHSAKLKGPRMTPEDFIKNNRGINDNADLPDEYLRGIFEEIANNEIVLNTERETAANLGMLPQPTTGLTGGIGQALANVGRDLQREAYVQAAEEMATKTEQLYKSLLRAQRRGASKLPVSKFIPASSFKHVGPMFEVTWMPFLTALSGQAQDTHNLEVVKLCCEGLKLAIRISCLFDLENPRQAFVAALTKFTNLYNLSEMKAKNVEALKVLLEVAHNEGDLLKESWRDILTCISQLDRFQLISTGVDEKVVPDVLKAHIQTQSPPNSRKSLQVPPRHGRRATSGNVQYQADIAEESRSTDIIRSVDRIFTNTANLSGEGIVYFVKALTQVSWQEIQSSGQSESPRTFSLQKLVEISGYNMTRVRFEWTNIWQILGEHFNQVGCHTNTNVVFFALNSLRQLSMKFMEIEELPGFKFQKDFLKPFEHIMSNSTVVAVKDMVLRCLIQMIQARGENIRSGWRTMFGVFTVAAREPYEGIVSLAFDNVTQVYNTRFGVVISQGAFADLIVCLTEFSKNHKFQKKSLQAIELLKSAISKMLRTPECPLSARTGLPQDAPSAGSLPKQPTRQTQEEQFWFPVLFAFHDVLMTGEDLEVRSRALTYLFETLIKYGGDFPQDFWDTLWRQLLYPIFMVLKSKSEMSKVLNHEELSVWLSTTMIQALRNMINLFTHFFDSLEYMLDRFLELLALCICQENDTLARIGSNCLQQLILQNVMKFKPEHWHKIVNAFVELFARTEATALFSAATSGAAPRPQTPGDNQNMDNLNLNHSEEHATTDSASDRGLGINGLRTPPRRGSAISLSDPHNPNAASDRMPSPLPAQKSVATDHLEDYRPPSPTAQQTPVVVTAARRRFFNQIITKCVLSLLMIETVSELFSNDSTYHAIPSHELLRLMGVLKRSYHFAKRFNEDRELRARLFREGFMRQPPNLLKQESGAASVYVAILFRMFADEGSEERKASRAQTADALVPLCADILASYATLDPETQQRNILTWRPVVVTVLEGYLAFPDDAFAQNVPVFGPLLLDLLGTDMGLDVQRAVQAVVARIFERQVGVDVTRVRMLRDRDAASTFGGPLSPRGSVASQGGLGGGGGSASRRASRGR